MIWTAALAMRQQGRPAGLLRRQEAPGSPRPGTAVSRRQRFKATSVQSTAVGGEAGKTGARRWRGTGQARRRLLTGGHAEAVHHGGEGGKAGDSARLQPRKPLAEAAQEQDAAMAVRGSGEVRPLGRGDFGDGGGESKVQRRELQPARLGRQPKVQRRESQPTRSKRGGGRLGNP